MCVMVTSAGRGLRFGSWDRAHLPLPFSPIELHLEEFVLTPNASVTALQEAMILAARHIHSPILPDAIPGAADNLTPLVES